LVSFLIFAIINGLLFISLMKIDFKKINSSHLALMGILVVVMVGGFSLFKQEKTSAATEVLPEVVAETLPESSGPADMDVFAKCLNDSGAKLFGAVWCPHCQAQKKVFGESVQYINYIECSPDGTKTQAPVCKDAGIQGYPTWQFADGSEILGEASFEQLSERTLCPL